MDGEVFPDDVGGLVRIVQWDWAAAVEEGNYVSFVLNPAQQAPSSAEVVQAPLCGLLGGERDEDGNRPLVLLDVGLEVVNDLLLNFLSVFEFAVNQFLSSDPQQLDRVRVVVRNVD